MNYAVAIQTPQYRVDTLSALQNLPITSTAGGSQQVLGAVASIERSSANAVVSQQDIQALIQIFATPDRRDLGAVAADIERVVDEMRPEAAARIIGGAGGSGAQDEERLPGHAVGFARCHRAHLSADVVNFQSWTDPFIIITALPAALAGIVWMLFLTGTALSVPSLTGAIMCMGVATANSVLVISLPENGSMR